MLKRMVAVVALLGGLASLGISAAPAFSEDSGVVNATVTVASPCLIVPSTAIDYGTKAFASTSTGESTSTAAPFNVTSCSQAQEIISVSGASMSSATSSAVWTLSSAATTTCFQDGAGQPVTLNRYKHEVTSGTTPILLTTSNASLGVVGASGSASDTLSITPKLYMPCSGSDGVGQTMSTTITFLASY